MGAEFAYTTLPACVMTPERTKTLLKTTNKWVDECEDKVSVKKAKEAIAEYCDWQTDNLQYTNRRSVSFIDFGGYRSYITGGMTWGDPPTDTFSTIILLGTNVYDVLLKWAKEDYKEFVL